MEKINFEDLPSTDVPIDSTNLNLLQTNVENAINDLPQKIFPVGSIYISVTNTNPSSFLGGTWVAFGQGRTLVGVDASQTEFNSALKTGGSKNHNHTLNDGYAKISTWGGQGGGIAMESSNKTSIINTTAGWILGSPTASQHGNTVTALGGNTDSTTNLQPYITVYFWRRVS